MMLLGEKGDDHNLPFSNNTDELILDDYDRQRKAHTPFPDGTDVPLNPRLLSNELTCPICLDLLSQTMTTKECLHRFCADCITQALLKGNKECPTCRKKLVSKRSLRPDPNFDSLINKLWPDRRLYDEAQAQSNDIELLPGTESLMNSIGEGIQAQDALRRKRSYTGFEDLQVKRECPEGEEFIQSFEHMMEHHSILPMDEQHHFILPFPRDPLDEELRHREDSEATSPALDFSGQAELDLDAEIAAAEAMRHRQNLGSLEPVSLGEPLLDEPYLEELSPEEFVQAENSPEDSESTKSSPDTIEKNASLEATQPSSEDLYTEEVKPEKSQSPELAFSPESSEDASPEEEDEETAEVDELIEETSSEEDSENETTSSAEETDSDDDDEDESEDSDEEDSEEDEEEEQEEEEEEIEENVENEEESVEIVGELVNLTADDEEGEEKIVDEEEDESDESSEESESDSEDEYDDDDEEKCKRIKKKYLFTEMVPYVNEKVGSLLLDENGETIVEFEKSPSPESIIEPMPEEPMIEEKSLEFDPYNLYGDQPQSLSRQNSNGSNEYNEEDYDEEMGGVDDLREYNDNLYDEDMDFDLAEEELMLELAEAEGCDVEDIQLNYPDDAIAAEGENGEQPKPTETETPTVSTSSTQEPVAQATPTSSLHQQNPVTPSSSIQQQSPMMPTSLHQQQNQMAPSSSLQQQNPMAPPNFLHQQNPMKPSSSLHPQNHMMPTHQQNPLMPSNFYHQHNPMMPLNSLHQQNPNMPSSSLYHQHPMMPSSSLYPQGSMMMSSSSHLQQNPTMPSSSYTPTQSESQQQLQSTSMAPTTPVNQVAPPLPQEEEYSDSSSDSSSSGGSSYDTSSDSSSSISTLSDFSITPPPEGVFGSTVDLTNVRCETVPNATNGYFPGESCYATPVIQQVNSAYRGPIEEDRPGPSCQLLSSMPPITMPSAPPISKYYPSGSVGYTLKERLNQWLAANPSSPPTPEEHPMNENLERNFQTTSESEAPLSGVDEVEAELLPSASLLNREGPPELLIPRYIRAKHDTTMEHLAEFLHLRAMEEAQSNQSDFDADPVPTIARPEHFYVFSRNGGHHITKIFLHESMMVAQSAMTKDDHLVIFFDTFSPPLRGNNRSVLLDVVPPHYLNLPYVQI